jgi:transposase InsO family protein
MACCNNNGLAVRFRRQSSAQSQSSQYFPVAQGNLWTPATHRPRIQLGHVRRPMTRGYAETYRRSIDRPEEFWAEAAAAILRWMKEDS